MKTPAEMGLPRKFTTWRNGQEQAYRDLLACEKDRLVQVLPTGVGKSLLYMAGAVEKCEPTVILTSTKALQSQLVNDFSSIGLVEVRGKRNYRCVRGDGPTCEDGLCHYGVDCDFKGGGCPYYDALRQARQSRYVVTNYAMWLSVGEFLSEGRKLLVMDEAHAAPDHLNSHLIVDLDLGFMSKAVGRELYLARNGDWRGWLKSLQPVVTELLAEGLRHPDMNLTKLRELAKVQRTLDSLSRIGDSPLVVDEAGKNHWVINPLTLLKYAEPCLFRNLPVHMTSATVTLHTVQMLGMKDYEFYEYPSPFPVENRAVVVLPTVKVDRKIDHGGEMMWLSRIDQIVGKYLSQKGIIHTVSYDRAWRIVKNSKYRQYSVMHRSSDTILKVAKFKNMRPPAFMVSPAMTTGWDFPYELCKWQIIAKVPFPDFSSNIMRERMKLDPDLLQHMAWQTLVQEAGRGTRAEDDHCITFVVDDHFKRLHNKYGYLAPRWFKDAIRYSTTLPEPRS